MYCNKRYFDKFGGVLQIYLAFFRYYFTSVIKVDQKRGSEGSKEYSLLRKDKAQTGRRE